MEVRCHLFRSLLGHMLCNFMFKEIQILDTQILYDALYSVLYCVIVSFEYSGEGCDKDSNRVYIQIPSSEKKTIYSRSIPLPDQNHNSAQERKLDKEVDIMQTFKRGWFDLSVSRIANMVVKMLPDGSNKYVSVIQIINILNLICLFTNAVVCC